MKTFYKDNWLWLAPVILMLLITPFTPYLDLAITRYVYNINQGFPPNGFYTFMYEYGPLPADITVICAIAVFIASLISKKLKIWQRPALSLILTLAIGSGLIVHVFLKDQWGRPRPKQVIEFGGSQPFRPYYEPNFFHQPEPSKSFPCGHCSVGFFFFALAFLGRSMGSRLLFWTGVILAVVLGVSLSVTRIAQGGHFLSDTLMSALIMWLTAYVCNRLLLGKTSTNRRVSE